MWEPRVRGEVVSLVHSVSMVQRLSRESLLDAATELVAERGPEAVSTRDIYEKAGVQAPTLYHYFGSKDGLMAAVLDAAFARYLEAKRAVPQSGDPLVDLRRGWDSHVGFARENARLYPLMFRGGPHEPEAAKESRKLLREAFAAIEAKGELRPGINSDLAAKSLSAALRGVATAICSDPTDGDAARMSALVRDAVIEALLDPAKTKSKRRKKK
jgi:AcrR family transcriptional regulator